jgi:hypothetical protein
VEKKMPDQISLETVTDTWQRMAETPLEEAQHLIDQMENEQPIILVYLLALDEYPFDQSEREIIFYIGTVLWQIMKQSQRRLLPVIEESVQRAEEENINILELLSEDTDADFFSATKSLIDQYPEPEVLRYLVEALMEDIEDIDELPDTEEDFIALSSVRSDFYPKENGGSSKAEYDELDDEEEEDDDDDDDDFDYNNYEVEILYDDDAYIRPENKGLAFVHLKTLLDAMIDSLESET